LILPGIKATQTVHRAKPEHTTLILFNGKDRIAADAVFISRVVSKVPGDTIR
jgi:hypothetical protein